MIANEQAAISAGQAVASKRSTTWWPLAVLVAINVLNFYDRQVAGAVVEPVRKEFHLSDTQIGVAQFAIYHACMAWSGLPLGLLADRISRKKLLAVGIVVWAASHSQCALGQQLFFPDDYSPGRWRGRSHGRSHGHKLDRRSFSGRARSKPLALFMLGVPVGGALSFFFTGPIALKNWMACRHDCGGGSRASFDPSAAHAA